MKVMRDSVDLHEIPTDTQAIGCYGDGTYQNDTAARARFPHAHIIVIVTNPDHDGHCLDVENGDATPDQAPAWIKRQHARGLKRPWLYANRSTMPAITAALQADGIIRDQVILWVADWLDSREPHIPTGYDACQWTNPGAATGGHNYDESLCKELCFAEAKTPERHASAEIQFDIRTGQWRLTPLPWNAPPLG